MGGGLLSFRLDEHAGKWLPHTELLLLGFPKMQIKYTFPQQKYVPYIRKKETGLLLNFHFINPNTWVRY